MAQGVILFTWHGNSNFFNASFEVNNDEVLPGSTFSSQLFQHSIAVTNPIGQTYLSNDGTSSEHGSFYPWNLSVQMVDFQRGTELFMSGGNQFGSPYRTAGVIWEQYSSATDYLWFETGYWSSTQIPEPSVTALLVYTALISFSLHRSISQPRPGPLHAGDRLMQRSPGSGVMEHKAPARLPRPTISAQ
jgi:hypothetical protein